jgi:xylulokinase
MAPGDDYPQMNDMASMVPAGSDGLMILPFGNGAERILGNRNMNASIYGMNFNIHTKAHILRAAQEGIVFALRYGLDIMQAMGVELKTIRAGSANMFLSPVFASTFATVANAVVELYNTDGSQGAARGAGLGAELYGTPAEAFSGLRKMNTIEPNTNIAATCLNAYADWKKLVECRL